MTIELHADAKTKRAIDRISRASLHYINRTPDLLSLLYDLDLLPEQLERYTSQWRQMLVITLWHKNLMRKLKRKP